LLRGAEDAGENLLTVGAAACAIAAAAHLAGDYGRAQRVFGAPVGGIERGIEKEAEDRVEFVVEMRGEAAGLSESTGPVIEQAVEPIDIGAARDGETVIRHGADRVTSAGGERGAQQVIDVRCKRMMRIVQHHRATATEQMRETGLMRGVDELPIRGPAIALEHAGVVGPEHPRRLRKAAAVLDSVGRRGRRRKGPRASTGAPRLSSRFHRA